MLNEEEKMTAYFAKYPGTEATILEPKMLIQKSRDIGEFPIPPPPPPMV